MNKKSNDFLTKIFIFTEAKKQFNWLFNCYMRLGNTF